jgi:hypothetical protein
MLKPQIEQLHAFSQVSASLFYRGRKLIIASSHRQKTLTPQQWEAEKKKSS